MSRTSATGNIAGSGAALADHGRRGDLQGLRAVAVLAVVAFHFGVPGVPGGFVGVDIFFVLSGFFITRLLMRDISEHGEIRLHRFWANRVKRLLPNALLVILAVLASSAALLPSYRLPTISSDAVSATAFFANFRFADRAVDYFHLNDPPSPLLHYWSLAVEEQFYIFLPLLMSGALLLGRIGKRTAVLAMLCVIAAVSLVASLIMIERSQPDAFFHPQYRAWQLALGGLVGLLFEQRGRLPATLRDAGAALGAVAVGASFVLIDENLSYPGVYALAPTLGTAALVFGLNAGRFSSGISRVLTLPPMVRIGDMSYSLYLWHWPVAVFLGVLWPEGGGIAVLAGLAVSGFLAWAAYLLVERPIHRMPLPSLRPVRVIAAGVGGVALVAGASAGTGALQGRSDPAITERITAAMTDLGPPYGNGCHRNFEDLDQPECRFGALGGPRVVLFGDSHGAHLFPAVAKAAEVAQWEVNAWTKTGCPTPEVTIWYPTTRTVYDICDEWREQRLRALIDDPPALVILSNSTRYYGWMYDAERNLPADRATAERLWLSGASKTAGKLVGAGIRVVELRDTPIMYTGYRDCLSRSDWSECYRPRGEALAGMAGPEIEDALYTRLDLSDTLCTEDKCPATDGGMIIYRDSDHLTATYAETLYGHFVELLAQGAAASNR